MSKTVTLPKQEFDAMEAEQERLLNENRKLSTNKCVKLVTTHRTPSMSVGRMCTPEYYDVRDGIYTGIELATIVDERLTSAFQELDDAEVESAKLEKRVRSLQSQLNTERNKDGGTVKALGWLVAGLVVALIYVKFF